MLREALTSERLGAMEPGEAAAWFVAQRSEGLTGHEETLLAEWRAADAVHDAAYRSADRAWNAFDDAEDDEILAAMREHALARPARSWAGWSRYAVAAVVVLAVAMGLMLQFGRSPAQVETLRYAAAGQVREITLPDGSTMTLDAQSVALARFGGGERSVELESGRALFDVKHDADRPFAVAAADRRVVVLGTQFEVDLGGKRLAVSLFRGRVSVEKQGAPPVVLAPGEQFVENAGVATKRKLETDAAEPSEWRHGLLDFDDRPLSEVVAEVNRYSSRPIVITDPAVAAMRVSGQFKAGDAERFARTVAEIHPLRVVHRDGEIELVPAR